MSQGGVHPDDLRCCQDIKTPTSNNSPHHRPSPHALCVSRTVRACAYRALCACACACALCACVRVCARVYAPVCVTRVYLCACARACVLYAFVRVYVYVYCVCDVLGEHVFLCAYVRYVLCLRVCCMCTCVFVCMCSVCVCVCCRSPAPCWAACGTKNKANTERLFNCLLLLQVVGSRHMPYPMTEQGRLCLLGFYVHAASRLITA